MVSTVKGSRNMQGFADHSGMTRFWSEEKPMGTGDELFRVKVVGSIPTDPTIPFCLCMHVKKSDSGYSEKREVFEDGMVLKYECLRCMKNLCCC
jgi:hypothetical protein